MFAIVETGGKQYKVAENEIFSVELLKADVDSEIELANVLAVFKDDALTSGKPYLEGAKVVCKVLAHGKGKKVIVFHYKAKKNIRKKNGHRQPFTKLQVVSIQA